MRLGEKDKQTNETIFKDYLEWIESNDIVCPYPDKFSKPNSSSQRFSHGKTVA